MSQTPTKASFARGMIGLTLAAATAVSLSAGSRGAVAQDKPEAASTRSGIQRLVLAQYYYWFQGDPRKPIPFRHVRSEKGLSQLTDHPWESAGPWMSFDRAQWHKNNFQMMAAGGIDVALAVYRGDATDRHAYAIKGLDVMTQGLKELRADGLAPLTKAREYPQIGMALDLGGLAEQYGGPVDLKDADVQKSLYGMVRDFYLHVPEEFRATIQLPPARLSAGDGMGMANTSQASAYIVRLIGDGAVKDADGSYMEYVNRRFAKEFGARLVWVGTPGLADRGGHFDAVAAFPGATRAAAVNNDGWIRIANIGPGYDNSAVSDAATIRPRENGQQTISDFRRIIDSGADWTLIDSWNGYGQGSDVAPSFEYGLLYRDLIRAAVLQYKQSSDYACDFLKASVPRVMSPGHIYQVDVVVQNSGTYDWDPFNEAALSYRWVKDGKYVGDIGVPIPVSGLVRGDKKTVLIGVAPPIDQSKSLPAGRYELELGMTRHVGNEIVWFDQENHAAFRVPVTVGPTEASRPYWINSTMPTSAVRGAAYPATLRIRNDGSDIWKKGSVSIAYRWRKVSTYLKGLSADADEVVAEGKRVPLEADVAPGRLISVDVPVTTSDAAGKPLTTWSPREDWVYVLEWDLEQNGKPLEQSGGATYRETVEVVDRDPAPSFVGCNLHAELVAGRTEKITVGLINNGPTAWKKDRDKVVVHWYYMDGTEASWKDESLPLQEDVPPFSQVESPVRVDLEQKLFGAQPTDDKDKEKKKKDKEPKSKVRTEVVVQPTILRDVPVHVPYYFGPMYCVFDFEQDGLMASTSSASKGNDLLVIPVNVYSPTFTPLPLLGYYNVDGISQDVDRLDGDIDGRGNSLPAEFLPPYVTRPSVGISPAPNPLYPSGLWVHPLNELNSSRVCFLYPPKNNSTPNMIRCEGQKVEFAGRECTAVHVLGLCTEENRDGEFVLTYADGSTEKRTLKFTHWNEAPKYGEKIAFIVPHRHTKNGDDPTSRCYLSHYTLPAEGLKKLVGLSLPKQPDLKVIAVTLESASIRAK